MVLLQMMGCGENTLIAALIVEHVQEAMVHGVIARSGLRVFFFPKKKRRVMEMIDGAECCCSGTAITGSSQTNQDSQYHSMAATETPC